MNFEEKQLAQLREKAKALHFATLEEFFQKIASEFLEGKEANFDAIMQYISAKQPQPRDENPAQPKNIVLTRHLDRIMKEDDLLLQKLA